MIKFKYSTIIICFCLLTSCGFKVTNNVINYNISEITTTGDNKINFSLKNKLLASSNVKNNNVLNLKLDTKKNKSIKEKNISNKITKYEIRIDVIITYESADGKISKKQNFSRNNFYDVGARHLTTRDAEKNIISLLINELSEDIIDYLNNNTNDI